MSIRTAPGRPVFQAKNNARRHVVRAICLALVIGPLAVLGQVAVDVATLAPLEPLDATTRPYKITLGDRRMPQPAATAGPDWLHAPLVPGRCGKAPDAGSRRVLAFLPADDAPARAALAENCGRIDTILAETYRLTDATGQIQLLSPGLTHDLKRRSIATLSPGPAIDAAHADRLLADRAFLSGVASRLDLLDDGLRRGLCLDLSAFPGLSGGAARTAIGALARDGTRCVIGAADAAFWDDHALIQALDIAVVQGFRRPTGPGDPPAPAAWFQAALDRARDQIPADKLVIALGTRGQSWHSGGYGLTEIGFTPAMTAFAADGAGVRFVPWANAMRARYVGADGALTETWLPDAVSAANQLAAMGRNAAVAVWPLGSEDPTLWPLLADDRAPAPILGMPIRLGRSAQVTGHGPIIVATTAPVPGQRVITNGDDGRVQAAHYATLAVPARIERGGAAGDGRLTLSFASLPPATVWPKLAAILDTADIQAVFLVDADDMLAGGDVARQAVADGHALGLRPGAPAFDAPRLAEVTTNYDQLLMESRTGLRTRLVEPRAATGWGGIAATSERLIRAGYIPLMPATTQSRDVLHWTAGTDAASLNRGGMDVTRIAIDPKDGGWTQVVASLPALLAQASQNGLRFQSLPTAAGYAPDQAMPAGLIPVRLAETVFFGTLAFVHGNLNTIFFWFLVFAAVRSSVYLVLALVRPPRGGIDPSWTPAVSVLIPAFNEAKVIESCIRSVLDSAYPNLRIIVVDDGSTDGTSDVVRLAFGHDDRVTLLRQENRGKWAAANAALAVVDTPFFVVADADSLFTPDTIRWLVQQFRDDRVGAVAGLVEVGNRDSLLGACQTLEYIVSQNILRRAQELFNGILVVPGAVGAWRTTAVRAARLFSPDTVTEDADLTLAVHRAGYRVVFQEQARSVTEAPSTARQFLRQRLRWTFGMLQTSWKNRGAIAEGRSVGYVSIIDAVWFSVFASLIAPVVDLFLLILIVQGAWAVATGGVAVVATLPVGPLAALLVLTVLDVLYAIVAFRFERRFDWKLLLLVPMLRFGYRQLLYISTIRAFLQALAGTSASWNKLDRSGGALSLWSKAAATSPALPAPQRAVPAPATMLPAPQSRGLARLSTFAADTDIPVLPPAE